MRNPETGRPRRDGDIRLTPRVFALLLLASVVGFGLAGVPAQPAYAAGAVTDCSVYDDGDPGDGADTLGEALVGGGLVTFACSGTIVVPEIVVGGTLEIDGAGNDVTLSGAGANRILRVTGTGSLALRDLALSDGAAFEGAAIELEPDGIAVLEGVTLRDNVATFSGGAIQSRGDLTVRDSRFEGNTGQTNGGGSIYVTGGSATIERSVIVGTGTRSGLWFSGGTAVLADLTITGHSEPGTSAISMAGVPSVTATNITVSGNSGGINGSLELANSIVTGNSTFDCIPAGGIVHTAPNHGCGGSVTGPSPLGVFDGRVFPLHPGSVAVDAGDDARCASTDQLGVTRPWFGGVATRCDLGAAELALPALDIADLDLAEGDSGTTAAILTVSLSHPALAGGVSFTAETADGSATVGGGDYVALAPTAFSIPAGQSTTTIQVLIVGNGAREPDRSFSVLISDLVGAVILKGTAVVTILDDDMDPPLPPTGPADVGALLVPALTLLGGGLGALALASRRGATSR